MIDYTDDIKEYFEREKKVIDALSASDINAFINLLVSARDNGKHIFIMGNGGSAATASHYVCDFNKGLSYGMEKRFKFICLNDNFPTMMAYANDVSYADVFVEPLKNFMEPGDLVIGVSGSGNSANVVRAIEWAKYNGGVTVGITGYDGGKLLGLCDYNVNVPVMDMQISEDLHMMLDHCIVKVLGGKC